MTATARESRPIEEVSMPYLSPATDARVHNAVTAGSPAISVVVVAYHAARWLAPCLASLACASAARVRLVLVDNGGNDNCIPGTCPDFDYVRLQTDRSLGFAEANNFALRSVVGGDSEAICFLNQDTLGDPGWLDACLECLRLRPDVGAVSPLLRTYDGAGWDPGFQDCSAASAHFLRDRDKGRFEDDFYAVPRVSAAAMVVRRVALVQAGPFDPIFGSYCEDYDLCRRIREAGFGVGISSRKAVQHFSGSSTTTDAAFRRRTRQIYRNRAILRFREAGRERWPEIVRYACCTAPRNLARGIIRTPSSQPVGVQLAALGDLVRLGTRLVSAERDEAAWLQYLASIDWPTGTPAPPSAPEQ